MQTVEILADSLNVETGDRLTTFLVHRLWKPLLAEVSRHRVLSLNAASSRAVPVQKFIQSAIDDPFVPFFTANKPGMSGDEITNKTVLDTAQLDWLEARDCMVKFAQKMAHNGIHKQQANRLLETFLTVPVLITATDWDNFFELRCHDSAQPELKAIADEMKQLYDDHKPVSFKPGAWHIPFAPLRPFQRLEGLKIATARSARLSYKTHLGEIDFEKDFDLHDRLWESKHLSPFEHCAKALPIKLRCRNFSGFMSYRAHLEDGVPV